VESHRFDSVSKQLATGATRRRVIAGLGALVLGGTGAVALTQDAAADDRRRCIERCVDRGGKNNLRQRRERCRRQCENR
jgi:hypothetical protein